jgi:peptidoglycan/xylan/chitin deacetylase (PgdA/CDA1 family)
MGAPAWSWFKRAALSLLVLTIVALIVLVPGVTTWLRLALLLAGLIAGTAAAFRMIPAFDPLGRIHWRLPKRSSRCCAITFDDGPCQDTPRVLEILDRYGVRATFFVLSANARRHPDVLLTLKERGHTIAIHGTTHRKIHNADAMAIAHELSTAIRELSGMGVTPARFYRTPHGLKNAATFKAARDLGCQLWAWSRGIWDTDRPQPEVLVRRVLRLARAGMVLLLHDGRGDEERPEIGSMLAALPGIIEGLRAAGFTFVTLDQT